MAVRMEKRDASCDTARPRGPLEARPVVSGGVSNAKTSDRAKWAGDRGVWILRGPRNCAAGSQLREVRMVVMAGIVSARRAARMGTEKVCARSEMGDRSQAFVTRVGCAFVVGR